MRLLYSGHVAGGFIPEVTEIKTEVTAKRVWAIQQGSEHNTGNKTDHDMVQGTTLVIKLI